jgi:hypothetical protein
VVSRRYVDLMNGRYARLIATAWDGGTLDLQYDGDEWTATLTVRPTPTRHGVVSGTGATQELALKALETELGLERWSG